jgi:hypothetical protein
MIPVSDYFASNPELIYLSDIILFAPFVMVFFWLISALYGVENRYLFLMSTIMMCVFAAIPLGIIYPLSKIDFFGSYSSIMSTVSMALFGYFN